MNNFLSLQEDDEKMLGCSLDDIIAQLPRRLSFGVQRWIDNTPDKTAVVCGQQRVSYSELGTLIRECKEFLRQHSVRAGDRVLLVCENGLPTLGFFLAASEMDAIVIVGNARLSDREINLVQTDSDPRLVIYTTSDSTDAQQHAINASARKVTLSFAQLMVSDVFEVQPELVHEDPVDQTLAMIYTTGTTGAPKGVMLTHRNLTFIAFVSGRLRGIRPGEGVYCVLPMSHVFGLSAVCASVLFSGGCVFLDSRFDAQQVLTTLADESIVGFLGVPTMYALLLEAMSPDWRPKSLRFMYSGGSPMEPDLKRRVQEAFGLTLHNGYGLTESGPTICQTRQSNPLQNTSVGYCLPGVELKVVDGLGQAVSQGEVGELLAKGPNIMKGYFRRQQLTAEVLIDGWFHTGDLVYQDESGAVNIAGRSKELIIRSGFNVYPPEVEAVLTLHPQVSLCAVVGQSRDGNEDIVAFVQPVAGETVDHQSLLELARQNLSGYKVPNRIIEMETLPAASSGKILKHQLKQSL
ncbi:MAG: AMP-binding protein [Pseudomonadales bacterium]|jgi:long-chain acyl-CoA synthetase|nr:AMP-binding protein [Pseudomonadales bacterium]MDG1442623.1 AMP-binding protein [Pseudomonadales bacterium]